MKVAVWIHLVIVRWIGCGPFGKPLLIPFVLPAFVKTNNQTGRTEEGEETWDYIRLHANERTDGRTNERTGRDRPDRQTKRNAVSDVEVLGLIHSVLDDRQMEMERDDDGENWPDGKGN